MDILKVKNSSSSKKLGKYVYMKVEENKEFVLQAIGAGALSQAVKATIEANKLLAAKGIQLAFIPSFEDIKEADFETTGIRLKPFRTS